MKKLHVKLIGDGASKAAEKTLGKPLKVNKSSLKPKVGKYC